MIWVTTLILLVLAALFIREGMREKHHYLEKHDDPASVADEGLFMDAVKRVAPAKGDTPPPIEEEDTLFARATRRVQRFDSPVNRLMDRKSEEAKTSTENRFDRIAQSVSKRLDSAGKRYEGQPAQANESTSEQDLLTRMSQRVARAEQTLGQGIAAKAEGRFKRPEPGTEQQAHVTRAPTQAPTRAPTQAPREDWLSRQAAKIGPRMEAIDDRMTRRTREITERLSRDSSRS